MQKWFLFVGKAKNCQFVSPWRTEPTPGIGWPCKKRRRGNIHWRVTQLMGGVPSDTRRFQSHLYTLYKLQGGTIGHRTWFSRSRSRGALGARPLCPQDFFKFMQFSGNFKGKPLILSKFWVHSKLHWPPLTKILDPRLFSPHRLWFHVFWMRSEIQQKTDFCFVLEWGAILVHNTTLIPVKGTFATDAQKGRYFTPVPQATTISIATVFVTQLRTQFTTIRKHKLEKTIEPSMYWLTSTSIS